MRYELDHVILVPKGSAVDVYLGADNEDPYLEPFWSNPDQAIEALVASAEVLFDLRKFRLFKPTEHWDVDEDPFNVDTFTKADPVIVMRLRHDHQVVVTAYDRWRAQTIEVTFTSAIFDGEELEFVMPPLADLRAYEALDPQDSVAKFRSWFRGIGDLVAWRWVVADPQPLRAGPPDINTPEGAAVFRALTAEPPAE